MHLNHCVHLSTGPHWKLQRAASHFKPQTFPLSSPPASLRSLLRASLSLIPSPEVCFHMWLILELGTRQRTSSESLQNKCTDVQPCEKLCNPHRSHRPPLTFLSVSLNTWQSYLRRGSPAPYSTVSFPPSPWPTIHRSVPMDLPVSWKENRTVYVSGVFPLVCFKAYPCRNMKCTSFLWPNNIPLHGLYHVLLSVPQVMNIWVVSSLRYYE